MPPDAQTHEPATAEELALRVNAIKDRVKNRPFDERFRHISGSYLFDVEGAARWRINIDRGRTELIEGADTADCIIRTDAAMFIKIAKGEQNLLTASMRGLVEIEGDMALAQKIIAIMPGKGSGKTGGLE